MASSPGFEPGLHWWEASALTTAPTLLPPIFRQNWGPKCWKIFFRDGPSHPYLWVRMTACPPISRSGFSTAISTSKCQPCMYLLLWSHKYRAVNTIWSCCVYDTSRWGIKQLEGNMFGSIFLQFSCKSRQGHVHNSWGKSLAPGP